MGGTQKLLSLPVFISFCEAPLFQPFVGQWWTFIEANKKAPMQWPGPVKLSESKDMQANVYFRHLGVELGDKLSKDDWVHVVRKQVQKAPISLSKSKSEIWK